IPQDRKKFFGPPIKVILPGPEEVGLGAGSYSYVHQDFCFYDWAQFKPDGTVRIGRCGSGTKTCISQCEVESTDFHSVSFGTVNSVTYNMEPGVNIVSFPFNPHPARFASLFGSLSASETSSGIYSYVFYLNEDGTIGSGHVDSLDAEAKRGYFVYLDS